MILFAFLVALVAISAACVYATWGTLASVFGGLLTVMYVLVAVLRVTGNA
jgi:hypothetical protein